VCMTKRRGPRTEPWWTPQSPEASTLAEEIVIAFETVQDRDMVTVYKLILLGTYTRAVLNGTNPSDLYEAFAQCRQWSVCINLTKRETRAQSLMRQLTLR